MKDDTRIKRSFGLSAIKEMMTPGKQSVLDAVNRVEQCRDHSRRDELLEDLMKKLSEYEAESKWNYLIMKSMAEGASGEFTCAIATIDESLLWAKSKEQKAISLNNKGDHCRRAKRFHEAVSATRMAAEMWPDNLAILCNHALSLAKNGDKKLAAEVLAILIENSDFENPRDVLAAHLKYEEDLQELLILDANFNDGDDHATRGNHTSKK